VSLLSALMPRRKTAPQAATILPGSPDAVEVDGRFVRVGDGYTTTLAVTGYPAEVGPGWAEPILAYPGLVDVTFHIEPIPPAVASDRLRKQRGRFESSRRQDAAKGRLDDPELDTAAADAAELAMRVARGEARLFRLGMYLTVHGVSPEELADRVAEVRSLAASLLLNTAPVTWRQLQGWITGLPLAYDALGMKRVFDTDALAASFPFTSPDLPDTAGDTGRGVLFGLNLHSAGVVVWDRWAQSNYNAVILARSGEGKSYLAKLDLLRNLCLGVEAFVIDPEDEYLRLANAVGGTVIRPGAAGVRINPLDLPVGDDDAFFDRIRFMHTVLAVMGTGDTTVSTPLPADEGRSLEVAVQAAYRAKGINSDPRTWRRPAPLLADVMAELENLDDAGRRVAARLHPYVAGSMKGLFDGPTTTVPHGHLVVYAIKDLPEQLHPVGTLLTLDTIWRTVRGATAGGGQPELLRMVLVDEAWKLLSGGRGGRFLEELAKSARKHGTGLTVVTQDAADVLSTKVGRAVVSNAATQVLLRQAPQAIDAVADTFGLTDGERAFLLSCQRGDALLAAGSARVAFHAQASDIEHELIVTGPAIGPVTDPVTGRRTGSRTGTGRRR
jgi:type IV secretory pathway VirB4 component